MLKAVLEKPFKFELLELDIPVAKKKEVSIKVLVAGICGSDLHAYRGTHPFLSYPRVLGHEPVRLLKREKVSKNCIEGI